MKNIPVMAWYFPNWHPDPRNDAWHGKGWTEWEVAKCARPRFPGHEQPRVPLWGYEDESDPAVMEKKIDAALRHGIDGFEGRKPDPRNAETAQAIGSHQQAGDQEGRHIRKIQTAPFEDTGHHQTREKGYRRRKQRFHFIHGQNLLSYLNVVSYQAPSYNKAYE